MNLVSNAVKYTDEGSVRISYELKDENRLEIAVSDTGTGIEEQYQQLIFDRFQQGNIV